MTVGTRSIAGVEVGAIGLGCMNLSHAYGIPPPAESATALLHRGLEFGVSHFDAAARSLLLPPFGRQTALRGSNSLKREKEATTTLTQGSV